jgi:hypothetical protein
MCQVGLSEESEDPLTLEKFDTKVPLKELKIFLSSPVLSQGLIL